MSPVSPQEQERWELAWTYRNRGRNTRFFVRKRFSRGISLESINLSIWNNVIRWRCLEFESTPIYWWYVNFYSINLTEYNRNQYFTAIIFAKVRLARKMKANYSSMHAPAFLLNGKLIEPARPLTAQNSKAFATTRQKNTITDRSGASRYPYYRHFKSCPARIY